MKNLIKVVVFLGLLLALIIRLGNVFAPRFVTYDIIPGYNSLKDNSIDALFIGDSDIYSDISPMEIYKNNGITSYNYASPAASNLLMYYMLKEALKTQTPKIVIMDGTTIFGDHETEAMRHQAIDLMPLDDVKWSLINDSNYNFNWSEKLSAILPFFRYHDRWNKLKGSDFTKGNKTDTFAKGYIFLRDNKKTKYNEDYMDNSTSDIEFKNNYLPESVIKSKEYCESLGIKFLFVTMPDASTWSYAKYEKLNDWTKENGIDYLDFNILTKEIDLDFGTDSIENGMHLNINGAIKVSKYMGDYLSQNYGLTNHTDDPDAASFQNDLSRYLTERNNYLNLNN